MPDAAEISRLLSRLAAERLHWIDLEPGRAVQVQRPSEVFMASVQGQGSRAFVAACAGEVVDWRGFTLRDIGAASDEPLPFSARAWGLLWPDRLEWTLALAEGMRGLFEQHARTREDAAKN